MKQSLQKREPSCRKYLYATISLAVMGDRKISASAKVTFAAISNLCESRPEHVATIRKISELAGMSESHARKSIQRLVRAGYIRTQRYLHGAMYEITLAAKMPLINSGSDTNREAEACIQLPEELNISLTEERDIPPSEGRNSPLPERGHSAIPRAESSSRTPRQQQEKDSNKNELDLALEAHLGAKRQKGESHAA